MTQRYAIPADRIPVSLFREILIWPLALHLGDGDGHSGGLAQAVTLAVDRITQAYRRSRSKWEPVDDPIRHIPPPGNPADHPQWQAECYAEGVYFHEFVQSFLYRFREPRPQKPREGDLDQAPFRLFQRTDISELVVCLPNRNDPLRFAVERLNLYLFRTGAAILIMEVVVRRGRFNGLLLSDVLTFRDFFRRAYPPYAVLATDPDDQSCNLCPDLVVQSVVWRYGPDGEREKPFKITPRTVADMVAAYNRRPDDPDARGRRFAPVFEHWRWLLEDALPLAPDDKLEDRNEQGQRKWACGEGRWHQVVDERMPSIATVSVHGTEDDPRHYFDRTRRGDLVRLCFADKFSSDDYPYDRRVLHNFEKEHVYDRFRQDGTRYFASGYSFVAYGYGGFFENVIATHMRRHYFQMGLLVHFELASLLAFSSRISRAVERHDLDPEGFERQMETIEDEFLQFIHRFRFTGVSNHVQAQELFDLWRRHLRLKDIFDDLHLEITSATRYLGNRAASRDTHLIGRLTAIGTIGLVLGLAFSALGMNILVSSETWQSFLPDNAFHSRRFSIAVVLGTIATFAWFGVFGIMLMRWMSNPESRFSSWCRQLSDWRHRLSTRSPGGALLRRRHRFTGSVSFFDRRFLLLLAILASILSASAIYAARQYVLIMPAASNGQAG